MKRLRILVIYEKITDSFSIKFKVILPRPLDVCLSFVLLFTIFIIVVTQILVLKQSNNATAKCTETLSPPPSIQYLLSSYKKSMPRSGYAYGLITESHGGVPFPLPFFWEFLIQCLIIWKEDDFWESKAYCDLPLP